MRAKGWLELVHSPPLPRIADAPEGGYDLAPGSCALIPAGTVFSLRTGDEEGGGGGGGGKGRKHKQRGSGGGGGGSGAAGGEASLVLLCTLAPQPAVERAVSHAVALAKVRRLHHHRPPT